jgi:hypothetical protein
MVGGNVKYLTLSRANLETFTQRIPPEALSKTFQDAIVITREFGIGYLWIDSLCIIQDDADDWNREASSMSGVYGSSTLNIAASGASDGSIGCFFKQEKTLRCQIEVTATEGKKMYNVVPRWFFENSFAKMPLCKRGWALQERVLPRRNLHFTFTQVFWECHERIACETFPSAIPPTIFYRPSGRVIVRKLFLYKSAWEMLVGIYSACQLTKSSDKLVAMSGLARHIQLQTTWRKEEYVAGLWREGLELQLCWEVILIHFAPTVPPYRAPSWSWASVDTPVILWTLSGGDGLNIKILQVYITPSTTDPFGDIKRGELILSCDLLIFVTIRREGYDYYMQIDEREVATSINLDHEQIIAKRLRTSGYARYDPSAEARNQVYKFYALPVQGYRSNSLTTGLLLDSAEKKGEFRRAGVFRVKGRGKEFEEAVEATEKEECFPIRKDESGKFIISII